MEALAIITLIKKLKLFVTASLFIGIIVTACSPAEVLTDERDVGMAPGWYDEMNQSNFDSESFYGSAMAAAADSAEAVEQSLRLAEENLRYAIDEYAEEIRASLAEQNETYSTPTFIVNLRNTVHDLDFSDAETEHGHVLYNGTVHHGYSRLVITRQEVIRMLEARLDDGEFISSLRG